MKWKSAGRLGRRLQRVQLALWSTCPPRTAGRASCPAHPCRCPAAEKMQKQPRTHNLRLSFEAMCRVSNPTTHEQTLPPQPLMYHCPPTHPPFNSDTANTRYLRARGARGRRTRESLVALARRDVAATFWAHSMPRALSAGVVAGGRLVLAGRACLAKAVRHRVARVARALLIRDTASRRRRVRRALQTATGVAGELILARSAWQAGARPTAPTPLPRQPGPAHFTRSAGGA